MAKTEKHPPLSDYCPNTARLLPEYSPQKKAKTDYPLLGYGLDLLSNERATISTGAISGSNLQPDIEERPENKKPSP